MFEHELPGDKTLISIPSFSVPDQLAVVSPTFPEKRMKFIRNLLTRTLYKKTEEKMDMMNVPVIQTP